jgi:hypothetical protein
MSILSADLHKAIRKSWSDASLDDVFTTYWAAGETDLHTPYNDGMASPDCPLPYCIVNVGATDIVGRSSGSGTETGNRHQRDYPVEFKIYAGATADKSSKQIASELADEIIQVFGGHPSVSPVTVSLENGASLDSAQHISDFGLRVGDEEYLWTVNYNFRTEVLVAN